MAAGCRLLDRPRERAEVPILVFIDIEPDARDLDPRDPGGWHGFERLYERLPPIRERLSELTGAPVAFTWGLRMDPQIAETWGSPGWVAEAYGDSLAELERAGDELGLHVHDWHWDADDGHWAIDHADPAWGEHCLRMAFDAFERAFGRPCAVHRGGDHFLSGPMLASLQQRGVRIDLTVEPGLPPSATHLPGERVRGRTPDYRSVPSGPYRSSAAAFPAPDPTVEDGLILVPLASAPGRHGRLPLVIWRHPDRFALRLTAELWRRRPPVLAFSVRSDAALTPLWDTVVANLEHLGRHRRMRLVTGSTVADGLDGPSSRHTAG